MDPLRTEHFDRLGAHLDSFIAAWDTGGEPDIADHLPAADDTLRTQTLLELVKIDLEYRWANGTGRLLDVYVSRFPELTGDDGPAAELIYEEYRQRRAAGAPVSKDAILDRYPARAAKLEALFELDAPSTTGDAPRNLPEPGGVLADFLLLERLGRGAFATVFLARQQSMHRTVALKVSADRGDEAQTLAQLDHPNIVRVFDQRLLPDDDLRLVYMEYIPAGSLEAVVERVRVTPANQRSGRLLLDVVDETLHARGETAPTDSRLRERLARASWPEAVCIQGALLADALGYAHGQGVLHRDVKPANVLLSRAASAKLANFNISYSDRLETSPDAYLGGSMAYMAPEQLEACCGLDDRDAAELDGRADVFALGVVLFELLTGTRPFDDGDERIEDLGAAIEDMIARRRAGLTAAHRALVPKDAPRLLLPTLERALAPAAEQRFTSAADMARRLDLCTLPRAADLVEPPESSHAHWLRRHALWALLAAAVLPSALLSLLNTLYNVRVVIKDPSNEAFQVMVMTVNGVAFPVGIAVLVLLIRPLTRKANALALDHPGRVQLRTRLLRLPEKMMAVVFPLWVLGGIAFPVWLGERADPAAWINFTGSNCLFGVLAATATYFAAMELVLHGRYASAVVLGDGTSEDTQHLRRAGRRSAFWFAVLASVPFVALISLALVDVREPQALIALGLIGGASLTLAYRAMLAIRDDLRALESALSLRSARR